MHSQNARFFGQFDNSKDNRHPAGHAIVCMLREQLLACGWTVRDPDNWRDSGWYLTALRGKASVNVVVASIGNQGWLLQIAPTYTPGILARLFGRVPSASTELVHDMAVDVHAILKQTGAFENIVWRWDGYPDEQSSPTPVLK